jgi:hypothetical protein
MSILRDYALSFLSKPRADFLFSDSGGFVTQILKASGHLPDDKANLSPQAVFDLFHQTGNWNKHGFGSLVFYGRGVLEIGHVAFMLDPYTVLSAHHTVDTFEVVVRPLLWRMDKAAVIRPDYESLGWI